MKIKSLVILFVCISICIISSCSDSDENLVSTNKNYSALQEKALTFMNGVWISNEIRTEVKMGSMSISMLVVPSDSIVFLSQYPTPKSFYAYDYLQGKETEVFLACGTCELHTKGVNYGFSTPSCYYYITPSADALYLYDKESMLLIKSYTYRAESDTRFYAGAAYNTPIIFNKQE